jgi:hypothetical protein
MILMLAYRAHVACNAYISLHSYYYFTIPITIPITTVAYRAQIAGDAYFSLGCGCVYGGAVRALDRGRALVDWLEREAVQTTVQLIGDI